MTSATDPTPKSAGAEGWDATQPRNGVHDMGAGAPGSGPAHQRRHGLLRWLLVVALLARALLGLADAIALSGGGMRVLPLGLSLGLGGTSAFWSTLLAVLALMGAIGLLARWPLGWTISVGACLAYLASGIGDIAFAQSAAPLESPGLVVLFVANLVVPSLVIVGLLHAGTACPPVQQLPFAFSFQPEDDRATVERRKDPPGPPR
jgi:hypothetical protein